MSSMNFGNQFIDSETMGAKDGTWSMKLVDRSSDVLLFDVRLVIIED